MKPCLCCFLPMFFGTFHNGSGEDLRSFFLWPNDATGVSFFSLVLFCGDHFFGLFQFSQKCGIMGVKAVKPKDVLNEGKGEVIVPSSI